MDKLLRIAIDGPAGAGKSTMAKLLAEKLKIEYIDTGAMYLAIALKLFRTGTDCNDAEALQKLLDSTDVDFENGHVTLDGEDINAFIRTQEVSEMASVSSAIKAVRNKLDTLQKDMAQRKSLVMDGRDITTVVIPNAEVKFYLTASVAERARRRAAEMELKGEPCDIEQIEKEIEVRDYRDSHRENSPLMIADDAIVIDSSDLSVEEVVEKMMGYIEGKR